MLTIIVRKQYILQHQSSQKYWIVQRHPNNSFKLFDKSFPTCFHTKLCSWKLMHRIRMYANAIQVSKCLMYTISVHNIVWQYTVSGNYCLCCMSLYWYKHDLNHWLHQTVWSGEMTIIRANCLVQSIINNYMIVHTCTNSTGMIVMFIFNNYTMNLCCLWADGQWGTV